MFALIFTCGNIFAQDNTALVVQQYQRWQEAFPKFRVEAVFNQNKYAPGDTAYFSAYYLTEQGNRIPGRQILQLSLYDCNGEHVLHVNFFARDGIGHNQIVLPDTLKPGFYEADIYSDWMRNFDTSLFFHQRIQVVDGKELSPSNILNQDVSFFPEGGNFVAGVTNRIIVRVRGAGATSGELVTREGTPITSFSIDKSGFGNILFTPEAGEKYVVRVNHKTYNLPESKSEKISVLLSAQEENRPVKVILGAAPGSKIRNADLTILIIAKGQIYASAAVKFGDKEFLQFNVPQTNLPPGVAELWVVDAVGNHVASRLFPVAESTPVLAKINVSPSPVGMRDKVSAELTLTDSSGKPLEADFSVSVVGEKLFSNTSAEQGERSFSDWDRVLITQPSKSYDWNKIMAKTPEPPVYRMDKYFHKRGLAYDIVTGQPVSDSIKISGFFLKNTNGYETYTNKKGEFDFMFLFDLWGVDDLFYTAERRGIEQKNVRIKWLDNVDHAAFECAAKSENNDVYGMFASKRKLIDRSYNFYTKPQRPDDVPENPNAILEDELLGADASVNIHDYILFPTMAETIREVIPMLKHRIVGGKSIVRAYVDIDNYVPTGDPLYIIDGVITRDTELFLSLVPDDVLTVKIVSHHDKLRALGSLGKNGVVFVQTKKFDPSKLRSGTIIQVTGLNKEATFSPMDYGKGPGSRRPDFRSTVFWAPSLSLPATGKKEFSFFTSDHIGPLRVMVTGVTKDGRLFTTETTCNVVFGSAQN